jgi:hypothetical protein
MEKEIIKSKSKSIINKIITKNINNDNFEYSYVPIYIKDQNNRNFVNIDNINDIDNISPIIEIFRYNELRKLANKISNYFISNHFEMNSNESLQIIKSIIFTEFNYINSNYIKDPIIPYNAYYFLPQHKISLFHKFSNFTEEEYNQ